jgi:multisubunit Na+/H+ antiporter MnhF subunit
MLISAVGAIGDRLDSKFITAYFFPAFVAVLGSIWVFVTATGGERFADRVAGLDSVEQAIVAAIVLLGTTMLAHMLRALARPIAQLFAGRAYPQFVQQESVRGQLKARQRTRIGSEMLARGERLFPLDANETAPTAFGNVLAAAADYPRFMYGMDSYHWWPRLLPLLPAEFQELLRSIETPMRAMLNLSLVSLYLGSLTAVFLGLANSQLTIAAGSLTIGVLCAAVLYRAAVSQATELARHIWVGFDLYRYQILEQLHEQQPGDLEAERELWQRLAQRLRSLDDLMATAKADEEAMANARVQASSSSGGPA